MLQHIHMVSVHEEDLKLFLEGWLLLQAYWKVYHQANTKQDPGLTKTSSIYYSNTFIYYIESYTSSLCQY